MVPANERKNKSETLNVETRFNVNAATILKPGNIRKLELFIDKNVCIIFKKYCKLYKKHDKKVIYATENVTFKNETFTNLSRDI